MFIKQSPGQHRPLRQAPSLPSSANRKDSLIPGSKDFGSAKDRRITEFLLREITLVVSTKRADAMVVSRVIGKYNEDNIPFEFLSSDNTIIRRLAVVLIGLIFEQKSDIFRYKLKKSVPNVTVEKNRIFVNNRMPQMRAFRPETLEHVGQCIFWYLPRQFFPSGISCYLDYPKLINILITKDFFYLPDPLENFIWMNFEEDSLSIEHADSSQNEESTVSIHDKREDDEDDYSSEEASDDSSKDGMSGSSDSNNKVIQTKKNNVVQNTGPNPISYISDESVDGKNQHKIRIFQFFKKKKQDAEPEPVEKFVTNFEYNIVKVRTAFRSTVQQGHRFRAHQTSESPPPQKTDALLYQELRGVQRTRHNIVSAVAMKNIVKQLVSRTDIDIMEELNLRDEKKQKTPMNSLHPLTPSSFKISKGAVEVKSPPTNTLMKVPAQRVRIDSLTGGSTPGKSVLPSVPVHPALSGKLSLQNEGSAMKDRVKKPKASVQELQHTSNETKTSNSRTPKNALKASSTPKTDSNSPYPTHSSPESRLQLRNKKNSLHPTFTRLASKHMETDKNSGASTESMREQQDYQNNRAAMVTASETKVVRKASSIVIDSLPVVNFGSRQELPLPQAVSRAVTLPNNSELKDTINSLRTHLQPPSKEALSGELSRVGPYRKTSMNLRQ